jgi:hypothetical protein
MSRPWITRALTSLLAALTALVAAATPAAAGLYVEQTVTSTGQGQGMDMNVRAWAEDGRVKVEYLDSNNPIMPAGSYLLTTDGGQTVYLVNPEEQTYSVWDMNQVFAFLGQMSEATGGMMTIDFKDPMSESLGSEPGGTILGYDTTHRTWRSGYTMDMKIAFMDQSNRMETTTEAWVTDEVEYPALGIWFTAKPPTTGDPELDQVLTDSMAQIDGMVLKLTQDTTTTNKKGQTANSSTTMEVTTLREESIDASTFAMPEGYTETPLLPMPAEMEGGEEGGPMEGLKGLFGRKKKDDGG